MAPKASKKAPPPPKKVSPPTPAPVNTNWESDLAAALFEEGSWRACVCFVVGGRLEDEELVQALAVAVQRPQRKLFTVLTLGSAMAKIHELGNPKKAKPDDLPMFYEITESAKARLDAGEEISCELMAKMLKFLLLQVKSSDQQRRADEQASEEKAKAPPPSAVKPPTKKGSAKKEKDLPSKEKHTKLQRRDAVELPKFIDDEPDDGPQHYILVLGFHQPCLIAALDAIGVHVANVIKVCSEERQHTSEGSEQSQSQSQSQSPVLDPGPDSASLEQARKLDLFWSGLRPSLEAMPLDSKLHDVALLSHTVPDLVPSLQPQETQESVLELGSRVFDGVAQLIYNSFDWRRQHQNYLNHIKLISVPTFPPKEDVATPPPISPHPKKKTDQETERPPISTGVDMRYYRELLTLVPAEACSVPLILNCMLEQVVFSSEPSEPPQPCVRERPKPHDITTLDRELVDYMLQSFLPLVHTEEEKGHMLDSLVSVVQGEEDKETLVEKFGANKKQKKLDHPLVIRHHDERKLRLRDISPAKGVDLAAVELSMIKSTPAWELIHSDSDLRKGSSCWMATEQQLQHYCTDDVVSWPQVQRLLHQSVFETMPLTRLGQNNVLHKAAGTQGTPKPAQRQQPPTIIPWDNPQAYAEQQLQKRSKAMTGSTYLTGDPDKTERFSERFCPRLELSDIQSCRQRSLLDWHYAEHHDASVFPQVLQAVSEEYLCLDTFRGSNNNTLYIFCHNPRNQHNFCKESWDVALHTVVKFRKYLEHVADRISGWTREEELKREAMLHIPESPKDEKEEEEDTLEPVIRKDSLKALALEPEPPKEEDITKKSKKENGPKAKPQKEEARPADDKENKALPEDTRTKNETVESPARTPTEAITTKVSLAEKIRALYLMEEHVDAFTGYSMDWKLIHVSGCLQHLFPSDGGHITVENISYVEGSCLMKLTVKMDGHHFYTHINQSVIQPSTLPSQPQNKEACDKKDNGKEPVQDNRVKEGSLTAVLSNGVHLSYSFYGPTGECRVEHPGTQESEGDIKKDTTLVPAPPSLTPSPSNQESKKTDVDSVPLNKQVPSSQNGSEESRVSPNVGEDQPAQPSPFNSLTLSVPNGLLLQFLREDTQELLVRQSFPLHGKRDLRQLLDPSLSKELSRSVTSQGAVIRLMRDGAIEVLFADGAVSFSQDGGPVWVAEVEVQTGAKTRNEERDAHRGCWSTTTPSGARICTVGTTHKHLATTPLRAFKATDPITHEVMLNREDLVVTVQNPNGSSSVKHADGTQITTLLQERPPNTGERHKSVTSNVTPKCVCGCTECVCVRPCTDSINDSVNVCGERKCDENALCQNVSSKERVVLVEKEGCATVVMYPDRHTAHLFLADGTVVTGNNQGAYQVFPSNKGLLQIQSDGKCVYSSDPLITPSPMGDTPANKPGSYTMSHTDKVACDITDADGNHFQVMEDGQVSVLNASPTPSSVKHDEEEQAEEEDDREASISSSRLFVVHKNGSGTELLCSQTVEKLLHQAYSDPTIAVQKEPLPDTQGEFGITILKPSHQNVWSQWILGKQNPDITPPNLTNRSWRHFPSIEKKTPGPEFGTNMGQDLTLRESSGGTTVQNQPVRSCPNVLEMRELYQYQPCTSSLKNTIDEGLKEYIEILMERKKQSEAVKVKDPRIKKENVHASNLLNLVLSVTEGEDTKPTFRKRTSVDIGTLYRQSQNISKDSSSVADVSYIEVKKSNWNKRIAKYRQELCEAKACRAALKMKRIVPYFHPENIPLYQNLLNSQAADMKRLTKDLPPIPKSDSAGAFLKDAPQDNSPRPLNPTPSQSSSLAAGSDGMPVRRPTNPTPQTAGESSQGTSSGPHQAVQTDVSGKPTRTKVKGPSSNLPHKPHSEPNEQSVPVENPVRACRMDAPTSPYLGARSFQVLPSSVNFGTVQEGTLSVITVRLKNVGTNNCRFYVKQPRPATGLSVIYNPQPVAAGRQVELHVHLFAQYITKAGEVDSKHHVYHDVVIHNKMDIFYLPVTATILPESLYDLWLKDRTNALKKKSSRFLQLSSSLPEGQGATHR